jgi:glycosyltransferase involved in cell wall biosynthesis
MTNPRKPKVSIGMPVYNGEKFIREALDSLVVQTFTDFELIISDNASTDNTESICHEYAARDARIRYVRQPVNKGPLVNFQYVLENAIGEYFVFNAADDFRSNDCIEYYLSKIGDAGGVFSTYATTNRKDRSLIVAKIPILSMNQTREESSRKFFISNRPSFFYGLYRRSILLEFFPREPFDWSDSYTVLQVISKYGFVSDNSEPKYFAGFYESYVPKPNIGKYIRPSKYFFSALGLAMSAGPVAFLYHLNTVLVSQKINARLLMINIQSRIKTMASRW